MVIIHMRKNMDLICSVHMYVGEGPISLDPSNVPFMKKTGKMEDKEYPQLCCYNAIKSLVVY